jgi:hypothetical protein
MSKAKPPQTWSIQWRDECPYLGVNVVMPTKRRKLAMGSIHSLCRTSNGHEWTLSLGLDPGDPENIIDLLLALVADYPCPNMTIRPYTIPRPYHPCDAAQLGVLAGMHNVGWNDDCTMMTADWPLLMSRVKPGYLGLIREWQYPALGAFPCLHPETIKKQGNKMFREEDGHRNDPDNYLLCYYWKKGKLQDTGVTVIHSRIMPGGGNGYADVK